MRAFSIETAEKALFAGPDAEFTHSVSRTAKVNLALESATTPVLGEHNRIWILPPALSGAEKVVTLLLLLISLVGIGCSFSVLLQPGPHQTGRPTVQSQ